MWHTYHAPRTVAEALELLAQHATRAGSSWAAPT